MNDSQLGDWTKSEANGKATEQHIKTAIQAEMGSPIPSGMTENILLACLCAFASDQQDVLFQPQEWILASDQQGQTYQKSNRN